ncbi:hypothetical protein Goklo_029281 [Gossypium klotzschianum]|uniref:Uncharacterized protein n=1 Tax=Gossypium klotzschianum TaxID=34286 RepID=A0A7J8WCY4_9ROSI|nr:hypothetical protein [Gossypium klotzschianum]
MCRAMVLSAALIGGCLLLLQSWADGNYYFYIPRPGVVVVQVEAMNFVATMKPKRAAHGGHAGEGQQRLGSVARGAHQGLGSALGKLYLLPLEVRCMKIRAKRQHQLPQQHRRGRGHPSSSLSTPAEDASLVATEYPVIDAKPHFGTNADVCTATNDDANAVVDNNVDA